MTLAYLKYFIGIEVAQSKESILISQRKKKKYALDWRSQGPELHTH